MLDHLIELLDEDCYSPTVMAPAVPGALQDQLYAPVTKMQQMQDRLQEYNHDMPFTARDKRRIVENMTFNEALTAVKSSDRLSALNMLGKMESINTFAAEKKVVEVHNVDELRAGILQRLGITPDQLAAAEVIDGEQV